MSTRTTIINSLIAQLETDTNSVGHRGYRFLHEINDFPSFYLAITNERRIHRGAGIRYGIMQCVVRGYCYSDSLDTLERYARDIETSIQRYRAVHAVIEEARVTSLRTDEGAMAPYGIVDMQLEVLYSVDYHYGMPAPIRADSTIVTADSTIYKADRE
jgi:hypothetical protein